MIAETLFCALSPIPSSLPVVEMELILLLLYDYKYEHNYVLIIELQVLYGSVALHVLSNVLGTPRIA